MPQPLKFQPKPLPVSIDDIGKRIANARKGNGLTQNDLAEQLGITRESVAAYESGRVRLSDEMIIRLSVALGISSDQLLGLTEIEQTISHLSLRITRRMRELDRLPENKKKTILQVLDDLIRANS